MSGFSSSGMVNIRVHIRYALLHVIPCALQALGTLLNDEALGVRLEALEQLQQLGEQLLLLVLIHTSCCCGPQCYPRTENGCCCGRGKGAAGLQRSGSCTGRPESQEQPHALRGATIRTARPAVYALAS